MRPIPQPPRHVFVYGTLMSDVRAALGEGPRRLLRWHVTLVGRAQMPGLLLDLGRYPAAKAVRGRKPVVYGEVWRLRDARRLLAILDAYEDVGAVPPLYERAIRTVFLPNGRSIRAWVYLYLCDAAGLQPAPPGRWRPTPA